MADLLNLAKPDTILSSQRLGNSLQAHLSFNSGKELCEFLLAAAQPGTAIIPGAPRLLPAAFPESDVAFWQWKAQSQVEENWPEDQVVTVPAGLTLGELDKFLSRQGQWWPVTAGHPDVTVGELIGAGEGGCLEQLYGGPRHLVLGLKVALASGVVIAGGGKVVKNVSGYDLSKLFIGSRSTLGIICSAHLRLFARPEGCCTLLWTADSLRQLLESAWLLLNSGLPFSVLELMDTRLIELFAEQAAELKSIASAAKRQPVGLLIQVRGKENFVQEMLSAANALLPAGLSGPQELSQEQADLLCSRLSAARKFTIQVALPATGLAELLPVLPSTTKWQARPGCGRAWLYVQTQEEQDQQVQAIKLWAEQSGRAIVLAFGDEHKEYKVVRHPLEPKAEALKAAIKARYDGQGCLNPVVSL